MDQPFLLRAFPRAILHIDANSFFAACEQAVRPELRGRPVVTGKERGIVSAASPEAKALGVTRGMPVHEVQNISDDIVHLPSDYETYSLFSKRMFEIVRRYTNLVEEYSIDECFADITGMRQPLRGSYENIAGRIQRELQRELGITFSIGVAPSKVLAKLASDREKPSGLVTVPGREIHRFLADTPIEAVWGIGPQTSARLMNSGVRTALTFARQPEEWVRQAVNKPHREIWHELRGEAVLELETQERRDHKSISKVKTFTPPRRDRGYIRAQLSKNAENACIKARRYGLAARRLVFILRRQDFNTNGYEVTLSQATNVPSDIIRVVEDHLDCVYRSGVRYRATGIVLADLQDARIRQADMFGTHLHTERRQQVFSSIDALSEKYGKHTVFLGSSFSAVAGKQHDRDRAERARRTSDLFPGESARRRLGFPMLGDVS